MLTFLFSIGHRIIVHSQLSSTGWHLMVWLYWFYSLILKGVRECCYLKISIHAIDYQVRLLQVVGMQHGSLASYLAKEFLLHGDGVMLLLLEGTRFVVMVSINSLSHSHPFAVKWSSCLEVLSLCYTLRNIGVQIASGHLLAIVQLISIRDHIWLSVNESGYCHGNPSKVQKLVKRGWHKKSE